MEFSRADTLGDDLERTLVDRSRSNDLEAFGRIVDAYQARVFGFVKRMVRDEQDALDLTQEVFVKAFRNMGHFDGRSSLKTWLFKIANNLCIDRSRYKGRRPVESSLDAPLGPDEEPMELPDASGSPEQRLLQEEFRERVEGAIASMSEKLRNVLLLHDKEDLSYEEVALALEIPVGTVKSRLFLARAHLQRHLGDYMAGDKA